MIRFILGMVVLLVATCFATGQAEPTDKKAVVKQVFEAWKERRAKCKSVRYKVSGATIVPKGSIKWDGEGKPLASPLPLSDVSCPKQVAMLLDFGKQRYRYEQKEKYYRDQTKPLGESASIWTYNGKEYWSMIPPGSGDITPEDAGATVVTGNLRETAFTPEEWPLFISHGFIPTFQDHILPGRFQPKLDEKEFFYHTTAAHAGSSCTVVRTEVDHFIGKSFSEYWVDMARGAAVAKMVVYVDGSPVWDLDMRYRETPAGWLVAGWTTSRRTNGRTDRIYKMRVDALDIDPIVDNADFEVALTSGMKVTRIHRGGNEDSIAPAVFAPGGSEQTFEVDERGRLRLTGGTPAPRNYLWWAVGGGVFLLLLLGWLWRGRRKAASKP